MGGDVTELPEPIGATYTVAGVQHCTITTAAPDANLYTEEQLKQFGRDVIEEAAQKVFSCNTAITDILAKEIRELKEQL